MTEEVVVYANPTIVWLQTRGMDIGLGVLCALLILVAGGLAIRILSAALVKVLTKSRLGRQSLIAKFIVSVVVKTGWAFLAVIVLGKLGVDVGPLIAGLGVTGFVLGFAFRESLGSFAAGLMIAFNQPFKVGDYVLVAGHEERSGALDMMAVVLTTGDNRRITIPNRQARARRSSTTRRRTGDGSRSSSASPTEPMSRSPARRRLRRSRRSRAFSPIPRRWRRSRARTRERSR